MLLIKNKVESSLPPLLSRKPSCWNSSSPRPDSTLPFWHYFPSSDIKVLAPVKPTPLLLLQHVLTCAFAQVGRWYTCQDAAHSLQLSSDITCHVRLSCMVGVSLLLWVSKAQGCSPGQSVPHDLACLVALTSSQKAKSILDSSLYSFKHLVQCPTL